MQEIRKSEDRGLANHGWLNSRHSFSFAGYFDEQHVEFGVLRVINEDRVAPAAGFGTHPHRDMEIISYVLEGALAHRDSMGNGSVIRPGDVQRMSAGTGVFHSEHNASATEGVHFLQIWIRPDREGVTPGYEQKYFAAAEKRGRLRLIVSGDGAHGSVRIHQDARIHAGLFDGSEAGQLTVAAGRRVYVHLVRGELTVNGTRLGAGDALKLTDVTTLELGGGSGAEVLVFDLPGEHAAH
ncbi:MAG TPA: pirin family protein [Steroidobacteraceae bacterium]|nr:pirin family protein [Steroidobacteraceae bacterium]